MRLKGKIVKWKSEKGFGFIKPANGTSDVFFHENFLVNQSRRPVAGEEVSFEINTNNEGQQRAERILFKGERDPRTFGSRLDFFYSSLSFLFLICIGVLVYLNIVDPVIFILYLLLSIITFLLYWLDKIKAQKNVWRIPEKRLHFFSLIGGWPGALIAQRRLRHKSRKQSFLVVFYITVIVNISAVAFYCYSGADFISSDLVVQKVNQLGRGFSKNSQDKPNLKQAGPVYSWVNEEGKTVYSNKGFPADETYRDGKIEWK